jgi:hypothetical protein
MQVRPIPEAAALAARRTYSLFLESGGTRGQWFGGVRAGEATGRATCRCCGRRLERGEPALQLAYQFPKCTLHPARVWVHAGACAQRESARQWPESTTLALW